jgi:CO/xanthine dehydrogenase Mo-binding subunit
MSATLLRHFVQEKKPIAAIANAVYHATGTRIRKLPIRIEKLLTA